LIGCFDVDHSAGTLMFWNFFESLWSSTLHSLPKVFRSAHSRLQTEESSRRQPRMETWPDCNSTHQTANERLDMEREDSFNLRCSGAPIALIGQKGIRCVEPFRRRGNSGAAPATVGGEPFSEMPLGFAMQSLGRRRRVRTREPGNLPERSHLSGVRGVRSGRTSAVVTERVVTRMEPAMHMLEQIPSNDTFSCSRIAKTAIPGTNRSRLGLKLWLAVTTAAVVIVAAKSAAADDTTVTTAPPIPYNGAGGYNWTGFYAGGNMGVGWGKSN
jgi:hypothetical protein